MIRNKKSLKSKIMTPKQINIKVNKSNKILRMFINSKWTQLAIKSLSTLEKVGGYT